MTAEEIREEYGKTEEQYEALSVTRDSLDGTWKDCAQLTLPSIFPDSDLDASETLPSPFNSLGPTAVNALASKLLQALLPPTGPFFRLIPNTEVTRELEPEAVKQAISPPTITQQGTGGFQKSQLGRPSRAPPCRS